MGFFDFLTGTKDPEAIQKQITDLDAKCATDKAALQKKLTDAEAASGTAPSGTAPAAALGGRRRKGGRHTKKHRKGSKRGRTGRRSTRL